jgi:hypothetical protein
VRFNYEIAKSLLKDKTPAGLDENLATAQRIATVFARESGNPRQCKRFLNTLMLRLAMAKSRDVLLKQRVLTKLMLLERFRPESFRSLADAQAKQNGKPKELAAAEKLLIKAVYTPTDSGDEAEGAHTGKVGSKPRRRSKNASDEIADENAITESEPLPLWLSEEWTQEWVRSEPPLAPDDLQPYFYFSRDKIGALAGATQRLTPRGQEVLAKLLSDSDAYRRAGIQELKNLSGADAAGVLDALSERARTEEGVEDDKSALMILMRFPDARPEMFAQILTLLSNLPDAQIPFTVPLKMVAMTANQPTRRGPVEALLKRWETQAADPPLRSAATIAIKRLT